MSDHALQAAIEQAEGFKNQGNEQFKQQNYTEAITFYSQAIELDPENAVYYSNRSGAYLATKDARGKALQDAKKCIELKPDWAKGYSRKGAAEHALNRFEDARASYLKGLSFDPDNQALQAALDELRKAEEDHSQRLKVEYQRQEQLRKQLEAFAKEQAEQKAQEEAQEKAKKVQEDDLLASFMSEVKELDEQANCVKKEEPPVVKPAVDFGSAADQIARLTQNHFEWINLNPFGVLMLDIEATEEDIKQHYRKLSTLVHPDKCMIPKAREAFEELTKAHELLKDEDKRIICRKTIENVHARVTKERRLKMKKGLREKDLPDETQQKKKEVMKAFAEIENRRRNLEKREGAQRKREADQQEHEQQKMVQDFQKEKAWAQTGKREKRVGDWRGFQKEGKKAKVSGPGWKEETRDETKYGVVHTDSYKKKWK